MALVSLRCSSCGADIELDETREFGFCSYCGTKVMMDKQIVELKGKVNVDGISTAEKLLERAFILVEDKEYDEAEGYFNKVLELEPKCAKAYWGKMLCEYRIPYAKSAEIKGIDITQSNNYKRAVSFATGKEKEKYITYGEKAAGTYGAKEREEIGKQRKADLRSMWLKVIFVVAPFVSFIFLFIAAISDFNIVLKFILTAIAVAWIVSCHLIRKQMKLKMGDKPSFKWFLNNLWSAAAGIFVVLCAVCSFVLETSHQEPSEGAVVTTTTIVETTEPTTEAPIEISAIKLIKEYQNNEIAFEKKYVGKTLLVSGVINDISSAYGSNYISVSDGDSWVNVDCYLRSSEEDKAAEFNTGDYITIKGKCTGESWGDPQLSSCEIVE